MFSLIRQINNSQSKDEAKKKFVLPERVNLDLKKKLGNLDDLKPENNKKKKSILEQNKAVKGQGKQVGGQRGVKRKGRLPSKLIVNKVGRTQTVYYRPDKKSKSKYVNAAMQSTGELMDGYKESFKRMLFLDHNDIENQKREKGADRHAWGADMVSKLDKLADKYGFTFENFDKTQGDLAKNQFKGLDEFLQDAENIYGEMYKIGDKHPFDFLQNIFDVTKQKLHTKHNRKAIEQALAAQGIVPVVNIKNNDIVQTKGGFKPMKKVPKSAAKPATGGAKPASNNADDEVDAIINDPVVVNKINAVLKKFKK